MSTTNQARIEFGTAGANIAGNIDVLLPQLAAKGAEVAKAGNDIHDQIVHLRQISHEFLNSTDETIQEVEFDKTGSAIEAILPQLSEHGVDVDAVASAIKGYCNQLRTLHAQHLHLVDENAPVVPGLPLVNNGIGSGPFNTGVAVALDPKDVSGLDPNPNPAGTGEVTKAVEAGEGKAELV
jgi:hypothetical protein